MPPAIPRHPKLHWKAFLRDFLLSIAAFLGLCLVMAVLWLFTMNVDFVTRKRDTAVLDLQTLHHAKHQRFPSTEEGLRALVDDLHLEQVPRDPWGRPYGYELRDGRPVVWSLGEDGAPGGDGQDEDIFDSKADEEPPAR